MNTWECIKVFNKIPHTDFQLFDKQIFVKDNLIIIEGNSTFRIWDIKTRRSLKVPACKTNLGISSFEDNLIIKFSYTSIGIWDINTGRCLKVLNGHTDWVKTVFAKDNLIISCSADKPIRVTPISLFPGELHVFRRVMDEYNLARHLVGEILDYFGTK